MHIATACISRIIGKSNIWQFAQMLLVGFQIFKLVVLILCGKEPMLAIFMVIYLIWESLCDFPNCQIKITTKQTMHVALWTLDSS